jgi:hypothetical protein
MGQPLCSADATQGQPHGLPLCRLPSRGSVVYSYFVCTRRQVDLEGRW